MLTSLSRGLTAAGRNLPGGPLTPAILPLPLQADPEVGLCFTWILHVEKRAAGSASSLRQRQSCPDPQLKGSPGPHAVLREEPRASAAPSRALHPAGDAGTMPPARGPLRTTPSGSLERQRHADGSESSKREQNDGSCLHRDEVLFAMHQCQLPKQAFLLLMLFQ